MKKSEHSKIAGIPSAGGPHFHPAPPHFHPAPPHIARQATADTNSRNDATHAHAAEQNLTGNRSTPNPLAQSDPPHPSLVWSQSGSMQSNTNHDVRGSKGLAFPDYTDEKSFCASCYLYCSVLPKEYQFSKDMLVSLWMAQGLAELEDYEVVEELCIHWFDSLLSSGYILAAGSGSFGPIFKLGEKIQSHLLELKSPKFQNKLDCHTDVTEVEHLCLDRQEVDLIDFELLKRCNHLQTLIIHCCYGSEEKRIPADLFKELKALKVLIVSRTNLVVLQCDLSHLRELRYLDVSDTSTHSMYLERICCLSNLETLKLDGCRDINVLPDSISELVNLRHLILRIRNQLTFMPRGIGKLTKLQTLPAFLVDTFDGRQIKELKYLNKLKGSIVIENIEKVTTKEEAAEALLCNKHDIKSINFCWSCQDEEKPEQEGILECLQPPLGIHELYMMYYSGGVLPSWMSLPFHDLDTITLHGCRFFKSLPSLGELPSLRLLTIINNSEVVDIGSFFCRKQPNHHVAFPKLEELSFEMMSGLEKWTGLENGDFPRLHSLCIMYCRKLVCLPCLSQLKSLSYMMIDSCPELVYWPEGGPPPMLETLSISDCPKLRIRRSGPQFVPFS